MSRAARFPHRSRTAVALAALLAAATAGIVGAETETGPAPVAATARGGEFPVPPPPFTDPDIFPCSGCHADMEVDYERRDLEDFHDDIELSHGTRERWCFDCHNPVDRDRLRLAGGQTIAFTESYRLCGQCHGDKYRDWRVGEHGKRSGEWSGEKSYLLCAHCHDPHRPHFAPIAPEPAPAPPAPAPRATRGAEHDLP